MDYVYNECGEGKFKDVKNSDSDDELDSYFQNDEMKNTKFQKMEKRQKGSNFCASTEDIKLDPYPTSTTCDPEIELHKHENEKKLKEEDSCIQQDKDVLTIKKYKDENIMNGGEILDGVTGFDGTGETFSNFKL